MVIHGTSALTKRNALLGRVVNADSRGHSLGLCEAKASRFRLPSMALGLSFLERKVRVGSFLFSKDIKTTTRSLLLLYVLSVLNVFGAVNR